MSKTIGGLKGRIEDVAQARAGLLQLVEEEVAESRKQWKAGT